MPDPGKSVLWSTDSPQSAMNSSRLRLSADPGYPRTHVTMMVASNWRFETSDAGQELMRSRYQSPGRMLQQFLEKPAMSFPTGVESIIFLNKSKNKPL